MIGNSKPILYHRFAVQLVLLHHKMCEMEMKSILKMYLNKHFISTSFHDIYPWDST